MKDRVNLIPGLGADERVFKHLTIPYDTIKIIKWITPLDKESLEDYCKCLNEQIDSEPAILLGVSFGGIVGVELNRGIKINL